MDVQTRREIKQALAANDLTLAAIARSLGKPYDRLSRIVNGYRPARPGEIEEVRAEIERLAALYNGPRAKA